MTQQKKTVVYIDQDFKDIVPDFIEAFHKNIDEIKAALKTRDFEAVRFIGHNLKGTGGGYGFEEISDIGLKLNLAAKDQDIRIIENLLSEMESYFSRIEIVYKKYDY